MLKIFKIGFILLLCGIGTIEGVKAQVSADSSLHSLSVSAGTLTPAFSPAVTSYTVDVASSVNSLTITAIANDAGAVISGATGTQALVVGVNTFTVTVTAEDGVSTENYQITITKSPKITASVRNDYGGTITPSGEIEMIFGSDTAFTFEANPNYILMSILVDGVSHLIYDAITDLPLDTFFFSNVTEDHTIELVFASTDARIYNITVDKGMLTPPFDPAVYQYTVLLGKNDTSITFSAVALHNSALVEGDTGKQLLVSGDNEFSISGIAESIVDFQNYEIKVIRPPYIIASSVNNNYGGSISPDGNVQADAGFTYSYTVAASAGYRLKNVLVDNVANPAALASGTYTFTDVKADHTIEAFFGATEARLANIVLSSGTLSPVFDAETYNYNVTVGNNVTTISIAGTPVHVGATANNVENETVPSGTTPFSIVVTAEDGVTQKTYTVNITRAKYNNADLASIQLSTGTLNEQFNANTISYTVNVPNDVTSITISGTESHTGAAVVSGGANGNPLLVGSGNSFSITVTAEDGSTKKIYTVTVIRARSSDANLADLQVSAGSLNPAFHPDSTNYRVNAAHTVTNVSVIGTANHTLAMVQGNVGNGVLEIGNNEFTITVTAEDGTMKLYIVSVMRGESSDANLAALNLNTGSLSPAFHADSINYTVNVPNLTTAISIQGIVNYTDGATLTGYVSNFPLVVGENTFSIIVTAQDRVTTKTYTITVMRAKSADADLKSLSVNQGNLMPFFNEYTTGYNVNVPNNITTISITGTAKHAQASVAGNVVAAPINVGYNQFNIAVTAEDATTTKTYSVTVVRAKSTDATLQNITVSEGTLTPAFGVNTVEYKVVVERDVETISISAAATHPQATLTGNNVIDAELLLGDNYFNIEVTAEDGINKRTYTVIVQRNKSADAGLSDLSISKGTLSPDFDADIINYTVNVPNNITAISLNATANFAEATVAGNVTDQELQTDENLFTIIVTAEDGITKKIYTVIVHRDRSEDATLSSLTLSRGTLTPAFNPNTTNYKVEVTDVVTTMTILGTANHEQATVKGNVNGAALEIGENTFELIVTAEDHISTKTYTIVVERTKTYIDGIDDIENANVIKLYPNPAKDIIYIETAVPVQRMEIYDMTGKMLRRIEDPNNTIDISDFAKGLYFIKMSVSPSETTIQKIVKE